MREFVNQGFGNVFDHGESACHIAIERTITHTDFTFVAGGQHHPAKFVGKRHQQVAANAGLQVLFRQTWLGAPELFFQNVLVSLHGRQDVKGEGFYFQIFRQCQRVVDTAF